MKQIIEITNNEEGLCKDSKTYLKEIRKDGILVFDSFKENSIVFNENTKTLANLLLEYIKTNDKFNDVKLVNA